MMLQSLSLINIIIKLIGGREKKLFVIESQRRHCRKVFRFAMNFHVAHELPINNFRMRLSLEFVCRGIRGQIQTSFLLLSSFE
jgi:hypothetical protein